MDKLKSNVDQEKDIVNKITIKTLIEGLDEKSKKIIMLRYYRGKTQSQVAELLGVTQVQVSRLEKKILSSMKHKLCSNMKKICLYIVIIIGLIFLFPVILTTRFSSMETSKSTENIGSEKYYPPYDYKKYGTINLINTKTNETTSVALDEYLYRCCLC